ncbi:hypothetical protein M5J20_08575 [Corynebacterium sp. TA-R-1]|uniref:Uncharacterized protein n=1 Tax=Corynebacterium stercoris TaxID=2943490 RepID=A0ABT1G2K4_9CORY|nr:hypothetical protein [Corynebacterium stercoris]MCP1388236.1 hypothetical protein [Corynebacterium stercoris]
MKKALRAGILAAALAASSVTVVNAPVVFAAEGDAAGGTSGADTAIATNAPLTLDQQIEDAKQKLETAKLVRDAAKAEVERLEEAIKGEAKPSAALQKAYDDAKKAEATKKAEYDAVNTKLTTAKNDEKAADEALKTAKQELETAKADVKKKTDAHTKADTLSKATAATEGEPTQAQIDEAKGKVDGLKKELDDAKSVQAGKEKAVEAAESKKTQASNASLLASVEVRPLEDAYAEAQRATMRAETALKAGVLNPEDAKKQLPTAQTLFTTAEGFVTIAESNLAKLEAQKENQGKGSSLPAFKDGDKLTPFGIAVIVVSALVAVLGLGAALLPQLQAFLPQLPF